MDDLPVDSESADEVAPTSEPGSALSRRSVLTGLGALAAGSALTACAGSSKAARPYIAPARDLVRLTATTPTTIRKPGSLPNPKLKAGTDTLPLIEHIVVLMMENHSYDDHFGMLKRGDGFALGSDKLPIDANPNPDGTLLKAYHMPS